MLGNRITSIFVSEQRHHRLINIGFGLIVLGTVFALLFSVWLSQALFVFVFCLLIILFGAGLTMPILSRLTLDASHAPMGIKITVFSLIRIGAGLMGAVCLMLFYNSSLFSIAVIITFFTTMAMILKVYRYLRHDPM